MYKIEAILLRKQHIRTQRIRLTLLTEEYGQITAWVYRSHCDGDTGSLCQIVIDRKNSINRVESIRSRWDPLILSWEYSEVIGFLETLRILMACTREGLPFPRGVSEYRTLVEYLIHEGRDRRLTLYAFRFLKQLGILDPTIHPTPSSLFRQIYSHIDRTDIRQILASEKIPASILPDLQTSIRYSLLSWMPSFSHFS